MTFPTERVALCIASGVVSSVVEKVTVNELTPAGIETVPSALLCVTSLLNVALFKVSVVLML